MRSIRVLLAAVMLAIGVGEVSADVIVVPSVGVTVDVARGVPWKWSAVLSVPIILHGEAPIGFSVAPTIYLGENEVTAFFPVHGVFMIPADDDGGYWSFFAGGGFGYHEASGKGEFVPVAQAGAGYLGELLTVRMGLDAMMKYKYFRDIDMSMNMLVGIRFND